MTSTTTSPLAQVTSGSQQQAPTYRSFQFSDSLEGTAQSMSKVKGRSPSSSAMAVPAYMPTGYNYESMTSDHQQQGQSRGMVRLDEVDDAAEEPARYDEPTQSELDRSLTIPKDMVSEAAQEAGAGRDLAPPEQEEMSDGGGGRRDDDDASRGRKGGFDHQPTL